MIQHLTDAVLCQSFHQSVAVKHPLAPQSLFQIVVKNSFGKSASRFQELPLVKESLIQSMINVRYRTLLEELQGNATGIQGNHTALAERVSTIVEFLRLEWWLMSDVTDDHFAVNNI